jgi:hypothetical protein
MKHGQRVCFGSHTSSLKFVSLVGCLLVVVAACGGGIGTPSESAITETTSGALTPFDLEAFANDRLNGALQEADTQVALVALVPEVQAATAEGLFSEDVLPGLVGVQVVMPETLYEAAEQYAAERGSAMLAGDWIAYGLVPRFTDTQVDEWRATVADLEGAVVSRVLPTDVETQIPADWDIVSQVEAGIRSGSLTAATDDALIVLNPNSTELYRWDGSWETGERAPIEIPAACCGEGMVFSTGESVVLLKESSDSAWLLSIEDLGWKELDPRPFSGPILGSALHDGKLVFLTAVRTDGESNVMALDPERGTWQLWDPLPDPLSIGGVASDGEVLYAAGVLQDGNNQILGDSHPVLYRYVRPGGWQKLGNIPIDGKASAIGWMPGEGLVSWNYQGEAAILGGEGWERLGDVPVAPSECYPNAQSTQRGLVAVLCGQAAFLDASTHVWNQIPTIRGDLPHITAIPSGVVSLVGENTDTTLLLRYEFPQG